ncbi:Ig-like domain-containing protein [Archaeoglobus veneficus]|nr:Ig-like domain-containing protein [Archaeoglobus veneficus]
MNDDRGVTVILGFILVLMTSMVALSVAQTTLVPDLCKKIEAEHMEKLTQQILSLAEVPETTKTVRLDMGVVYPRYPLLLTPSKAATSLSLEKFYINVSYTKILPNGTKVSVQKKIPTSRIVITPGYYFYPRESLIIENTAVFRKAGSTYVTVSKGVALEGDIRIVILNSTIDSLSTASSLSIALAPVSIGGATTVENVNITFESVNPSFWATLSSQNYTVQVNGNVVTIKASLAQLSFSEVFLSTKGAITVSKPVKKIYMLNPLNDYTLNVGETVVLGVKVVDEYDNPVKGVEVDVSVSGNIGYISPQKTYTDARGEAYAIFSATNTGSGSVTFSCGSGKSVRYDITVKSGAQLSLQFPLGVVYDAKSDGAVFVYGNEVRSVPRSADEPTIVLNTTNITYDDGQYLVSTADWRYHAAQRFDFYNISTTNVYETYINWNGYGLGWWDDGVTIYLWNYTADSYEEIVLTPDYSEIWLGWAISGSSIQNYVSNGKMTVLVVQNDWRESKLYTDYICVFQIYK